MFERIETRWLKEAPPTTNPLGFWWHVSRPYRPAMIYAFLCVIVSGTIATFVPYAFKLIVDSAQTYATTGDPAPVWHAAFFFIAASAVSVIIWRSASFGVALWATGARSTARNTLLSYVSEHSHGYFASRFTGSLGSKINSVSSSMRDISTEILWQFGGFAVTVTASFVMAFSASPSLAVLFLVWILVIVPFNLYVARKRVSWAVAAERAETKVSGASIDMLGNVNAVHEYARRDYEMKRLQGLEHARRIAGMKNWIFSDLILLTNSIVQALFVALMILGSIYLMIEGTMTPGDVVLILTIVYLVQDRIAFIGQTITNFSERWGVIQEGLDDIVVPYGIANTPDAQPLAIEYAALKFDDISFSYEGQKVLEHFTLSIPKGQRVGLVGKSGAGKSTLMKLILRHYDVGHGSISIDRQDIRKVTKESLREAIAVVPQDPMLFHRSIKDNIAYGKPHASLHEVIEAAKAAQAHEFIDSLPEG